MSVLDFLNRAERVKSSRHTVHSDNKVVEISGPIATPGGVKAILDSAIAAGLEQALEKMADAIRARAPSSEETGTRRGWHGRTKEVHEKRMTLREGLRTRIYEDEDGNPVGEIDFHSDVEYIAGWVEFGHEVGLWGDAHVSYSPPQPFMRPSYESGRLDLEHDTASGTRENFN